MGDVRWVSWRAESHGDFDASNRIIPRGPRSSILEASLLNIQWRVIRNSAGRYLVHGRWPSGNHAMFATLGVEDYMVVTDQVPGAAEADRPN